MKRVSRPELKALIMFINKYEEKTGTLLLYIPIPAEKQVVFIECHGSRYYNTHVFDSPKGAKEFLVNIMNKLTLQYGVIRT